MYVQPVVLCGGSGTRLWPLSRDLFPKQFLSLINERSLLQDTLARFSGLDAYPPVLVCNAEHRFLVAEQLRSMGIQDATIILEQEGRNTAPALALALMHIESLGSEDSVVVVMPSDHAIADRVGYDDALKKACGLAEQGYIVTFGVVATEPETGYGYIKVGEALYPDGFLVERFIEKPARNVAEEYISEGGYYWNSGIFVAKKSVFISEYAKYADKILSLCGEAVRSASKDMDFIRPNSADFGLCQNISIDYAVMEKTHLAAVVPMQAGWSDVGSFQALWGLLSRDESENCCLGDVVAHETSGCYISAGSRLVATVGVSDLVIVETGDAVLVASRNCSQDIKKIVARLREEGRAEARSHKIVYRPWGFYESIDSGDQYQVKRISVLPGASLSLQMHYHRAEHWIVVSGTAEVTCGERVYLLSENESTYIPLGERHRLHNPGKMMLEIIEVQSGSYLGEDDIVRFTDAYGRAKG